MTLPPPTDSWRLNAATEYLATLQAHGMRLELAGERLRIPKGHTPAEVALVRLLKTELIDLLEQDALDLREERAAILEHLGHFSRAEAEHQAGLAGAHAPRMEQTA